MTTDVIQVRLFSGKKCGLLLVTDGTGAGVIKLGNDAGASAGNRSRASFSTKSSTSLRIHRTAPRRLVPSLIGRGKMPSAEYL